MFGLRRAQNGLRPSRKPPVDLERDNADLRHRLNKLVEQIGMAFDLAEPSEEQALRIMRRVMAEKRTGQFYTAPLRIYLDDQGRVRQVLRQ